MCRDPELESYLNKKINNKDFSYISCVNDAIIRVYSASLQISSKEICPNQFRYNSAESPSCQTNTFVNGNVTDKFIEL